MSIAGNIIVLDHMLRTLHINCDDNPILIYSNNVHKNKNSVHGLSLIDFELLNFENDEGYIYYY